MPCKQVRGTPGAVGVLVKATRTNSCYNTYTSFGAVATLMTESMTLASYYARLMLKRGGGGFQEQQGKDKDVNNNHNLLN